MQDQAKDHLIQEVVTDPVTGKKQMFLSISTKDEVVELLSRLMAEDVMEEIERLDCADDVDVLAEHAGDARQDFYVYTRDLLVFIDNADEGEAQHYEVDMEVWKKAEEVGWLDDNQADAQEVDA